MFLVAKQVAWSDAPDCPISWPVDRFSERSEKKADPKDDEQIPSSSRPMLSLQLLRARNLLRAGHYEEACADYQQGLPKWDVPEMFQKHVECEWAIACYRLGKIDEALEHAKSAKYEELQVELLVKKGLYKVALEIADTEVQNEKLTEHRYHTSDELRKWLRIRALIYCRQGEIQKAVEDLKLAAEKYFEDDSKSSDICVREANVLIEQYHLGAKFVLNQSILPTQGKDKVLSFIKMLVSSPEPLDLARINEITGSKIKIPGSCWKYIHQEDEAFPPFDHFEYRRKSENIDEPELVMTNVTTNTCCVTRDEVLLLIPQSAKKVAALSTWSGGDESEYSDAWMLPTGRLYLRFGKGGARTLSYIEFNAPEPEAKVDADDLIKRSYWVPDKDTQKKLDLLNQAVATGEQPVVAYTKRADFYLEQKQFADALADAKHLVEIGGRFYLDKQIEVEEKMGNLDSAVQHMNEYIGAHKPGPETVELYGRLAELQIKNRDFAASIDSLEKAKIGASEPNNLAFLQAQAQAGLGHYGEARAEGKEAVKYYFDKAQIVRRDEVLNWLKSLPSN